MEQHECELLSITITCEREILSKLRDAGYSASEKETELFKRKLEWLGYLLNQSGVKPVRDKTEAITKLQAPNNAKEPKSFLGSIQHLSKFINTLSKTQTE